MNNIKQRNLNDGWGNSFVEFTGPGDPNGLLNMEEQVNLLSHRSGWNLVNNILSPLHNINAPIFDGFIEKNFAWFKEGAKRKHILPRKTPWIGVLHNPQNSPLWFNYQASPQTMFQTKVFQESLEHCKSILTLSDHLTNWVKIQLPGIPVHTLLHPGEDVEVKYDHDKFVKNRDKKIIMIGWWLRKLSSIHTLPLKKTLSLWPSNSIRYSKYWTLPYKKNSEPIQSMIEPLIKTEQLALGISDSDMYKYPVNRLYNLSHMEYDILLSKNIVYIDLWDSSANNTIVECIIRGTPIVAPRHPAVIEYLGQDYPLYTDSHDETLSKINDFNLILSASQYMIHERKKLLNPERFVKRITNICKEICDR